MFSTMALLDRWARGLGGKWLDAVERFIERKQSQGCDGGRVFGETTYWHDRDDNPNNDHKFFNVDRSTSLRMWNYGQLVRRIHPDRLTVHNQKLILKLIELARKHDFKIEFCTDATLKHSPGVGWDVIGHCIRQTSHFFNRIHSADWDPKTMGHPTDAKITAEVRAMFENVKGPINHLIDEETHNEFDAHSREAWEIDGMDSAAALREVNMQLSRHDRESDWPAGTIGVSHGGRDTIEYAVGPKGADTVKVHPSRSGDWSRVGDRFKHLERYGAHVYMNETKHFIDPSMWWTVEQGWFRPGSSTTDVDRILKFEFDCLSNGYSFCRHGLVDMANGVWIRGETIEPMELDAREIATGSFPPPPKKYKHTHIIALAYQQVLGRAADEGGIKNYDDLLSRGMSEADMRNDLMRSEEFDNKFGGGA
jgi:hypothetical protein